jgi:DNA mismatch repair protein MutL
MKRIFKLSPHLANQIAAGEVVERPASVLKELLENSLDAGSTQIDITVEQGGIGLIQVRDNGCGICKEDLELAVSQHATSKILTLADLEGVNSYGFRGEALASISAVSKLTLSSAVAGEKSGWSLKVVGRGKEAILELSPVGMKEGTVVEVRDLFYNTPARRKFLRSQKTEFSHLEEVFKRVALSQPQVAFNWYEGEKLQKRLTVCRSMVAETKRIGYLCGEKFIAQAVFIEAESNGFKLRGWLGLPEAQRSQPDLQYFYVNGRIVRDKVILHAIRSAYQDFSEPGRYPAYILHFELDPASLDVNVHPTKHEVRFREAKTVHAFLSYSISEALLQPHKESQKIKVAGEIFFPERKEEAFPIKKTASFSGRSQSRNIKSEVSFGKPLAVLQGELLVSENLGELILLDIRAAHRILLSAILEKNYEESGIVQKPLLLTKTVKVEEKFANIEQASVDWKRLGFEFSRMGPDTLLVRAVPNLFAERIEGLETFIEQLLKLKTIEDCLRYLVHYIVNAQYYSMAEVQKILNELEAQQDLLHSDLGQRLFRQVNVEQLKAALF